MPCAHMPSPSHANAAQQYYSGSYSSELLHFLSYSLLQELLVSNSVSNAKEESVLMMETAIPDHDTYTLLSTWHWYGLALWCARTCAVSRTFDVICKR